MSLSAPSGWQAMRIGFKFAVGASVIGFALSTSVSGAEQVENLTGLPVYPNLSKAAMDPVSRTDALGHWCTRFSAETPYPLDVVEAWYRKALSRASETDLTSDAAYGNYLKLSGIKLALGIDYVTVFRAVNQAPTSIELVRCSRPG